MAGEGPGAPGRPGPPPAWRLRIGDPPADALLPVDPELVGLLAGTRALVKRQEWPPEAVTEGEALAQAHGLVCATIRPTGDGAATFFIARDRAVLDEAVGREPALSRPGRSKPEGDVRWMGRALGYPDCCVARFLATERHDDLSLLRRLGQVTAAGDPPSAPPEALYLPPLLSLLSHAPCELACAATATLGRALLAALDALRPGYAARWLAAARCVVLADEAGGVAMVKGGGPVDGLIVERVVVLADLFAAPLRAAVAAAAGIAPREGDRLARHGASFALTGAAGVRPVSFVLDYRG